ncbi:L-type lectin-domain containing receptor kinase SIT2-like [Miscanthus floridulus]|uniref:L-type lectin-domain containing receptor kinase SIT2-like n=1 Tax=Miscanthus floridulus TaxID=154761 RepID=UPI003458CB70
MQHLLPMSSFLVAFVLRLCLGLLNLPVFGDAGNESFVFSGFPAAGADLTLDGNARVTGEGLLELTNNEPYAKGHAFHRNPVQFKDSPNGTVQSFSAAFIFAIMSSYSDLSMSSDSMALVIAPGKDFSNASGAQYLGLLNSTSNNDGPSDHFFAVEVELDTIKNNEFHDIDDNHVGVDINTLTSLYSHTAAFYDGDDTGGTLRSLRLISSDGKKAMQAWVDYDGQSKQLNVTLAPMGVAKKPSKPLLSNTTDLSAVIIDDKAYVGFSTATGPFPSQHCVLAWSFAVNGPAPQIDFNKIPKLPNSGHHEAVPVPFAVKWVSHDSTQGLKEFISEVVSIGHLRHRNLVQLLGYSRRKGELLLVYDYMPYGSLDKYLYGDGEDDKPLLEWVRRFQIVKDVASGLIYLHEKWEQVVVHRDVKASNVLLDGGMVAHLGDFGLARFYDHGADLQTTHVVGTMGYIAPELSRTGKASPLTDVYAFGTFLLEVTCGRRPIVYTVHHGRKLLVDQVLEYWRRGTLEETVDSRLHGNYDVGEARMVLTLGLMCSHPFPGERPTMRHIMQYLDGDVPLPELTPADMNLLSLMQNQTSFE